MTKFWTIVFVLLYFQPVTSTQLSAPHRAHFSPRPTAFLGSLLKIGKYFSVVVERGRRLWQLVQSAKWNKRGPSGSFCVATGEAAVVVAGAVACLGAGEDGDFWGEADGGVDAGGETEGFCCCCSSVWLGLLDMRKFFLYFSLTYTQRPNIISSYMNMTERRLFKLISFVEKCGQMPGLPSRIRRIRRVSCLASILGLDDLNQSYLGRNPPVAVSLEHF